MLCCVKIHTTQHPSHNISLAHKHVVWYVVVVVVVSVVLCECSHNTPLTRMHVVWHVVVVVRVTLCECSHNIPLTHIHVLHPSADRVAQNLESISKTL